MAGRLYHDALYGYAQPVPSLWEEDRARLPQLDCAPLALDTAAEVAIIGGGYCGLSAALHLARAGIEARVLEAGPVGWGASGRNAGFCCIGASFLDAGALRARHGETETVAFYRALVEAVRLVESIAAEEGIDIGRRGDGIWTFAHSPRQAAAQRVQAEALARLGVPARVLSREAFAREAFACTGQHGGLHEGVGFGLHPLAWALGLARAAQARGARVHERSEVTAWTREGGRHRLTTAAGSVLARRVLIATNGWAPEHLEPSLRGRVLPILSNIVVTRPLTAAERAAQGWHTDAPASDTRTHLTYLRMLPGHRLLLGGRGDTTGRPADAEAMQGRLTRRLRALFPAFGDAGITHAWRGFIAATPRLAPALGTLPDDPSIAFAFGCHGNGVAFMTWAGRELARRLAGEPAARLAVCEGLPPRLPWPATWLWQLRAGLAFGRVRDALG